MKPGSAMNGFLDFFHDRQAAGGFSTEDALAAWLPLARQVVETHLRGQVAPLAGLDALQVAEGRIWFADDRAQPPQSNLEAVRRLQQPAARAVEILGESRRTTDIDEGQEQIVDLSIGQRGEALTRPVYLPGYVCWEHELGHHDPLTDVFSLGLLLASLACGLDLNVPEELQTLVAHRDNLFAVSAAIHPVLARAVVRMTEIDRHRRPQDLPALVRSLENYRDQPVDLAFDPALAEGFGRRDLRGRRQLVLGRLRERLFDLSRQNRLLHFRATAHTVNLTHASVPLSFDVRNIRPDQILIWNDAFARGIVAGEAVSLNKYLNFAEAIYLPGVLDGIRLEARRDQTEFGFAQLRLVICFLRWADLKQSPPERYDSPLVLLPVELTLKKGVRDTFWLQAATSEAEVNPVVRHQFKQLYDVDLPETIDLAQTDLKAFFDLLSAQVQASEPAINVKLIERPRIRLIHERAQRRLELYRRRMRLAGRGVRSYLNLDYSYDPNNYHPLGLRLFNERIRPPGTRLRLVLEGVARPRQYFSPEVAACEAGKVGQEGLRAPPYQGTQDSPCAAESSFNRRASGPRVPWAQRLNDGGWSSDAPVNGLPGHRQAADVDSAPPPETRPGSAPATDSDNEPDGLGSPSSTSPPPASNVDEKEQLFFTLEGESETNPYTWEFDLCSVTLGNFRYRKMSLVRDYSALLDRDSANAAFDSIFSLSPREVAGDATPPPPLEDRCDVVACDPTQAGAIAQARSGGSYVIQGPPGTGKSQTITNLIADYVAQGRRVLFVCEKRAAIDVVFLRLRQQGLDELCSLIHDSQADKKQFVMELKGCYESLLAESGKRRQNREKKRETALKSLGEELAPLERYHEAMCSVPERAAVPLRSLLHRLVELEPAAPEVGAPSLSPAEQERVPYYAAWLSARAPLKRLADVLVEMRTGGSLARHPLRHLKADLAHAERPIECVSEGLRRATAALTEVEAAVARSGLPAELANTLDKVRQLVAYAEAVEPLARLGQTSLLDTGSQASKRLAKLVKQYRSAETAWQRAQQAAKGWTNKLPPADVPVALAQARRLEQTPLAFFKLDWWRLRSIIRRSYDFRWHTVRPSWVQLLELLDKEYQAAGKVADLAAQVKQEFGYEGPPNELADLVEKLRETSGQVSGVVGRLRDRLMKPTAKEEDVAALIAARPAVDTF
ncbi:MAG TPA: DUF4011 domain-containing protein, partial [Pirellulales bacterium]|nr:DUF4011 domain-containing protein [Pirellulales bacterium]